MKRLYIKDKSGKVFEVRKYCLAGDNKEQSVWCNDWYGRHVIGNDCEWYDLENVNSELFSALEELIQVKDWKDQYGKDAYYLGAQPVAWENAREAIDKAKKRV